MKWKVMCELFGDSMCCCTRGVGKNCLFYPCLICIVLMYWAVGFVLADDASVGAAVSIIDAIKDRVPDDDDYFRIVSDSRFSLTPQERANLFGKIVFMQKPSVQRKEILALYEAKRVSLHDCIISYTNVHSNDKDRKSSQISFVFAFSKNKLFLDKKGKRWDTDSERLTASYDGENLKLVREPDSNLPNASVSEQISRKFFYEPHMPLYVVMLFSAARCDYPPELAGTDFVDFLKDEGSTHVFQQEKDINGSKCIVVLNTGKRFFLDPKRDYSVVRFEQFEHEYAPNTQGLRHLVGRHMRLRVDNHDLVDHGNGIWLPTKTVCSSFAENGKTEQMTTIVTDVRVNKGITDAFFTDITPEHSFVFDSVRKMTYMQSDSSSINSLLKETAKSKRVWIFQIISMTLGIVLILIWFIIKYRQYLASK